MHDSLPGFRHFTIRKRFCQYTPGFLNKLNLFKLDTKFNGYGHTTIATLSTKKWHVEVCRHLNVTEAYVKVHIKGH